MQFAITAKVITCEDKFFIIHGLFYSQNSPKIKKIWYIICKKK